jgi:hypothetical protein
MSTKNKRRVVIDRADVEFIDQYQSSQRSDNLTAVGGGLFFKRQLEHIFSATIMADLPMPNALAMFDRDTEVGEGATEYTQRMMEPTGEAVIITNYADDLPEVNVVLREETRKIKHIGASYGYSVADILSAQMAGMSLDSTLGMSVREAIERKHNSLLWWGEPSAGIWGVLRHPNIPRIAFVNPFNSTSTPDDIIAEVNAFINSVNSLNKTTAFVDTVGLPTDAYTYIHNTPRSATSDTTIAEFLLSKNPFLKKFVQVWELDASLNDNQALIIGYRKSPMVIKYVAPIIFRQEPVQRKNLYFSVPCMASNGGIYAPKPLEIVIGEIEV